MLTSHEPSQLIDGGMSRGNVKVPPAGGRRRRLTLAPKPWKTTGQGEQEDKVCSFVYADSGRSGGTAVEASEEVGPELSEGASGLEQRLSWSSTGSSVGSSADPMSGLRRFWPVADEDISDEEKEAASGVKLLCKSLEDLAAEESRVQRSIESKERLAMQNGSAEFRPSRGGRLRVVPSHGGQRNLNASKPWKATR